MTFTAEEARRMTTELETHRHVLAVHREAWTRRKARDGAAANVLGTPPADEFGSLKLKWECFDHYHDGSPSRYESDDTVWYVSGGSRTWYAALVGAYAKGKGGRTRVFKSARAACKFIEDTKL
jgi:hypothetical protein